MADWQLGEIEITSVLEQVAEFMTLEEFFNGFTPEIFEMNKDWLLPDVVSPASGKMILPIQSSLPNQMIQSFLTILLNLLNQMFQMILQNPMIQKNQQNLQILWNQMNQSFLMYQMNHQSLKILLIQMNLLFLMILPNQMNQMYHHLQMFQKFLVDLEHLAYLLPMNFLYLYQ